ncbi:MAG: hypothetical protein J6W00_04150 [Lentisphaeria bacterium]|nr:hypothetical protein [Lentisphaeria bacterium]
MMGRFYSEETGVMNIQPGGATAGRSIRRQSSQPKDTGKAAICNLVASVVQAALFILVVGAFFHMYIKLDQEINAASAEIRKVDEKIASLDRDIEGLKGRYARCTSREFITQQIARFRLPLRPIRYDQQQVMRVYSSEQLARLRFPVVPRREVAMDIRHGVRVTQR